LGIHVSRRKCLVTRARSQVHQVLSKFLYIWLIGDPGAPGVSQGEHHAQQQGTGAELEVPHPAGSIASICGATSRPIPRQAPVTGAHC
jgi:hypothetical protein